MDERDGDHGGRTGHADLSQQAGSGGRGRGRRSQRTVVQLVHGIRSVKRWFHCCCLKVKMSLADGTGRRSVLLLVRVLVPDPAIDDGR